MPTDAETAAATAAAAAAAAAASKPWHDGIDAETIGHAQNKGWKLDDPKEAFATAAKQARELEKHFGVPPDQLLKMPKADAKPEDWAAFHQRLGAPKEAKEYDFSTIKGADGNPISDTLASALRNAAHAQGLSKSAATAVAADVQKAIDSAKAETDTLAAGKLVEGRATLEKNWGPKGSPTHDLNLLHAMEGARRLGPEFVAALEKAENTPGYAAIMEGMRRIGKNTSEDTFIERGTMGGGTPHTRDGAVARKAELMADKDWGGRYLKGGAKEMQEMHALNVMIDGVAA